MAEVRKHGAHWRVRWKHDGTREWIPLPERVATEAEAKREGARVLAILRAGAARRKTDVTSPEGEPLAAWAERWFEDRERRGLVSVRVDRQRLARWVWPVFCAVPLPRLTRAELERLVSALDEHVRERRMRWKTAANIWGLVTKMCSDACGSKLAALRVRPDDPARDVRGPDRGEPRELAYLYPDEAVKLLACPKVPPRWAALYALPMYLALRIGEVAALEASDVNLDASVVTVARSIDGRGRVTSPKNGRSRRVPIHPNARPLLEALVAEARAAKRERLVESMPARHGHDAVAVRLRNHLRMAGVTRRELHEDSETTRRLTYHDLRATCCTWWAIEGVESLVIQLRAGHADLKTTSRYVRAAAALRGADGGEPHPPLPERLRAPTRAPSASEIDAKQLASSGFGEMSPAGVEPALRLPERAQEADIRPDRDTLATSGDRSERNGGPAWGPRRRAKADPMGVLRKALDAALDAGDHALAKGLLELIERAKGAATEQAAPKGAEVVSLVERAKKRATLAR